MEKPIDNYWNLRLEALKINLEDNNFEVFIAQDKKAAKDIALNDIIPKLNIKSVSWGGSISFTDTGLYHELKDNPDLDVIDTFDKSLPWEEVIERRRQAILTDLFITGTNAVTSDGHLVNLDMLGNRVAAIIWGPKNVLLIIGRNKICDDLEDAMFRIKNYVAPVNSMRLDMKNPCAKTGVCHDCSSPSRICNHWTITEKNFEKGRIKIILVNEDMGF
jgi:L-lactate utilization protein LutB